MSKALTPLASASSKKHSIGWIIFDIIIALVSIVVLIFVSMFSYYLWIEKYGDETTKIKISERFSEKFTLAPGAASTATTVEQDIQSIIRTHNPQFGNADAPVTIVAFIDFECPFSQDAYADFERVRDRFGPAVHIVFKQFPVEQLHPQSVQAARAAQCAYKQQNFWPYYQQLFEYKILSDDGLFSHAARLGLDTNELATCISTSEIQQQINTDLEDGLSVGVRGTPTYIVNQQKIEGVISLQEWESIILQSLNQ